MCGEGTLGSASLVFRKMMETEERTDVTCFGDREMTNQAFPLGLVAKMIDAR